MLDGLFMLLSLSLVMAIASFLAGSLPLTFALNPSQLRIISTLGMGVLVGTSLIVIIPEGIETLYSASRSSPAHAHRRHLGARSLHIDWANFHENTLVERSSFIPREYKSPGQKEAEEDHALDSLPGPVIPEGLPKATIPPPESPDKKNGPDFSTQEEHGVSSDGPPTREPPTTTDRSPHAYVGLSMIVGFILMYLIDKVPRHASASLRPPLQPHHISLANLGQGLHRVSSQSSELVQNNDAETGLSSYHSRGFSTTIGLVIHAAADGIAMGASSSTSNSRLGFIIFLAIMVHKAPAAFGLTSVLLKQGLTKREARAHLTIFSLAAPVGAIATWTIVGMLGQGRMGGDQGTQWWTGILLLFSAGTFLYVAMHTMQERRLAEDEPEQLNGYAEVGAGNRPRKEEGPEMRDTVAAVVGMLLPLLTQFGHHH